MVDQALNRVIGYGATVDEISMLIRRGQFGMDGLCCWLEKCVSTLRIEEVLLENKVNRLVEAMRLAIAVSRENIPRIKSLMAAAQRAGASVFSILDRIKRAAQRTYSPKGYEEAEYQLSYLIYKIGGRAAANIAHRALGIPSIDTSKEHVATSPLISSSRFPTAAELIANVLTCFGNNSQDPTSTIAPATRRITKGMTMQVNELKIQERLRWDPTSNHILGVCREHTSDREYPLSLEFRAMHQADVLLTGLQSNKVHLATEATVIGASILSVNPNEYTTKAFAISGIYNMGSDGDSCRRRALINITLIRKLNPSSPIYPLLSPLSLLNLSVGDDDITCDFDWKHVFKRFRNTDLRIKGFSVDGVAITTSVIKSHLVEEGMSPSAADVLLAPNDRQDVILMIKLLHAIALLSPLESSSRPLHQSSRRVLCLVGRIYFNLLTAYLDVNLSLNEQLVRLSTAAHLILAIYHTDKGEFIPVQTCFDVMCMIKNIYFSVAKTQVDDPAGSFWIILLGTDGLEKVFGQVRTMVGNDTHADQLQLTNRIDGAVQCVKILENHPEWGGQSRRLTLKPLSSNPDEISSAYDHISPKSWRGDVRVQNVVLAGCWSSGRREAEKRLQEAQLAPPFSDMESKGGKKVHKATILRLYSNPFAVSDSKDRLKRVRGFSQYDESAREASISLLASDMDSPETDDKIHVQDPALILLRCNKKWSGAFEARSTFQNAEGRWVEPINPGIQLASRGQNTGKDTYTFRSSELRGIAFILQQRLAGDFHRLPEVPQTPSFPYRSVEGHACFVCEKNVDGDINDEVDLDTCRACRNRKVVLSSLSGPALVAHMGAHILHDVRLKDAVGPCGFCLNEGTLCTIKLITNSKGSRIDMKDSRCPSLRKITIKSAAKYSKESPCTNHPLACPLCPKSSPAVWKYNLSSHITSHHPTANVDLYKDSFKLASEEITLMKGIYQTVPRTSKKKNQTASLPISDGHSTRMALCEINGDDSETNEPEFSEEEVDEDEELQESDDLPPADTRILSEIPASQMQGLTEDIEPSRLRKRRLADDDGIQNVCEDDGCGADIAERDLLRCDAPGCALTYHLSCQGLFEKPTGGWFCDDECKKNAGFRGGSGRKRRRRGEK
ncbi:hypothetical protein GALMADRAFT_91766 [Galerina marginata CBS 339.88]|uniref:Zinc finger PHD-type domain-containing protein n=1 Tax=Galerina marginata (strain CBS 339.88) TaxID=685588 RepID=A0A067TQ06_GALM3|nr:hypothetical protein GALMADRAFT_91766 [Galerina marginata CBS 339.88]